MQLGRELQRLDYRFTTVSPATHARVNARPAHSQAHSLGDVFGWSRPFERSLLSGDLFGLMESAGVLSACDSRSGGRDERARATGLWRSTVRASTLQGRLFLHSAYPTMATDAVFFGPDTYRYCTALTDHLAHRVGPVHRAVDIGCGAGPGAVSIALQRPMAEVWAVDINDTALRLTAVNAALAGAERVVPCRSDLLSGLGGRFDLIVANPPYLLDAGERAYRHGGGSYGEGLSLAIAGLAERRLAPGGTLLLYTGSTVVDGVDGLRDRLRSLWARSAGMAEPAAGSRMTWSYREIDPDVFGEELLEPAYADADRIAAVLVTATLGPG